MLSCRKVLHRGKMKEINIADVLVTKRREKKITQEELACFIGVSKASVSKWETGQSYPDVTFLPQLASYFNISIDELIDYKPQMQKEDIRKLYQELSLEFTAKPFEEVMEQCREIIKKYYSCFPLLLQMGILIINHLELVKEPQRQAELIQETEEIFMRVRQESEDAQLVRQAVFMQALCGLMNKQPEQVLTLLEDAVTPALAPEVLLSSAYQMLGKTEEASAALQTGIYQDLVTLFNFFPHYLMLSAGNPEKFEEIWKRAHHIAEDFDLRHLHPSILTGLYIAAAQGYAMQQNREGCLAILQEYTELVTGDIYPLKLHGDFFFDRIESWMDQLELGTGLPRDEKTIRKSMADVILLNPQFEAFAEEPRYQMIREKLIRNAERD